MVREIKNYKLWQMLEKAGYGKVRLYKDNGLFYIDDNEVNGLCSRLESQCIYVCHFKQMTIRQWADTIIDMLKTVTD